MWKFFNTRLVKTISALTVVAMAANPVNCLAVGSTNVNNSEEKFEIPDIISAAEVEKYGYISRDKVAEKDLNTFVFKNADGTSTMKVYSHPVKYIDETGKNNDISLDISKNFDGSFVSSQHPVQTVFEKQLSDGIKLSYDDIDITMIPEIDNDITISSTEDTKKVEYVADENTSYVYGLTYGGFKEDIVVSEYTGQTEYDFTIYTNGLALTENDGSYFLKDEDDVIKATIGDIIILTADEKNNSTGRMSYVTVEENEEYIVTIHLDDEYLRNENTVYPIRIDPTIEVNYSNNGSGAIEDVTINSNSSSDGSSGSLYVGKRSQYGISRVLMKFPTLLALLYGNVHSSSNVIEANVEMRDLMCESESMYVYCYLFAGNSWDESSASWNNVNANEYSMELGSRKVSYSTGVNQENQHWYKFNITKAVKVWVDGSVSLNKGIIFKARDGIENGDDYISKTFASYNRVSYKPSLTIRFSYTIVRNPFFSKYNPNKINYPGQPAPNTTCISPQYRMNCYGYAFSYILNTTAYVQYVQYDPDDPYSIVLEGYKQNPGEFGDYWIVPYMQDVINGMQADAQLLGYTIEEYTVVPSSASPHIPQAEPDERMIAVVTGGGDYHFYMQHNDGTWSHKPSSSSIKNKSIVSQHLLTNHNIYSYANEGKYANGDLKFFKITKSANFQPHSSRTFLPPIANDIEPGDYLETSKYISTGNTNETIDFPLDHDVYYISATKNSYTVSTSSSGSNLKCVVYNMNGQEIASDLNVGDVNLSLNLSPGCQYFVDIYHNISDSLSSPINYQLTII